MTHSNTPLRNAARLPTDMRVMGARAAFTRKALRSPLRLSRGAITDVILASVAVDVEGSHGRRATGRGAIFLSDLWAWPADSLPHREAETVMRRLTELICREAPSALDGWGHPLEIGWALHGATPEFAARVVREAALPQTIPALAACVCVSPFDAALHDAYGLLHDRSGYDLLGPPHLPGDLAPYLGDLGRGVTLTQALSLQFSPRVPGCVVVGAADPLTADEVTSPIDDGLPNCMADWVAGTGAHSAKLKVAGRDPAADAAWVARAFRGLCAAHVESGSRIEPWISVDPNESYAGPDQLMAFLARLEEIDPSCFRALRYIEQPIPRAIGLRVNLHEAAALKPIFADESVVGIDECAALARVGWTGMALKTAKGHTLCLLLAAWSHLAGRPYVLQDLTNPSLAALQALGLAARLRTLNGIELNSGQFAPSANAAISAAHPGVFPLRNGFHDASTLQGPGLGYADAQSTPDDASCMISPPTTDT